MTIKVSVVMPVYNVEEYLRECLDSLVNQTLQEIEIICVDDGSTDSSLSILQEYKEKDPRVQILTQKNQYAGVARNKGLSIAKGEYVVFLDSDDFFEKTMLEKVYAAGTERQADIVLFGGKQYDMSTGKTKDAPWYLRRADLPEQEVFSRHDIPDKIMIITSPAPWTKAFNREFILKEGLQFQPLHNSNDAYFVLSALAIAERITYVDEDFAYYRMGHTFNLQTKKQKNPLCFLEAYRAVYDELVKRGIYAEVEQSYIQTVLSGCVYNLNTAKSDETKAQILAELQQPIFQDMHMLDYEEDFYLNREKFWEIKGAKYALAMYQQRQKTIAPKNTKIIKQNSLDYIPKVSVVIPVYNVEAYLRECLDSIVNQTLNQIEIICINDGSPDNSLEILKEYAEKDQRILLLSQENGGLSAARNRCMEQASGEYIYFMDSDDILDAEGLEGLYNKAKENNLDALYFDGSSFYDDEELQHSNSVYQTYYIRKNDYSEICSGMELFCNMVSNNEYRTSPCLQLLSREHILEHNLFFHEGILHEDNSFNFMSILQAKRACHTPEQYFHRRMRADSIMTSTASFRHSYGYFVCYLDMMKFVNDTMGEEPLKYIADIMGRVLKNARKIFYSLQPEERYAYVALEELERQYFEFLIVDSIRSNREIYRLRERLDKTYAEKSFFNSRLQETFAEKSEINRKLQITYREKAERGEKIKEQQNRIKEQTAEINKLKKEMKALKESRTYKVGRFFVKPFAFLKRVLKKGKKSA